MSYLTASGPLLPWTTPSTPSRPPPLTSIRRPGAVAVAKRRRYKWRARPKVSHRTKSTGVDVKMLEPIGNEISCQTEAGEEEEDESEKEKLWKEVGKVVCELRLDDLLVLQKKEGPLPTARRGEEIINALYRNIKLIKEKLGANSSHTLFHNVINATSALTSIGKFAVAQLAKGAGDPRCTRKRLNQSRKARCARIVARIPEDQKEALNNHIRECWKQQIHISLDSLLEWATPTIHFKHKRSVLRDLLAGMGYCFRKKSSNPTIEERKDLIFLRKAFMQDLATLKKDNYFVCCQDETWVFNGMTTTHAWQMKSDSMYKRARLVDPSAPLYGPKKGNDKGQRGIVNAILTPNGVLPGSAKVYVSNKKIEQQLEDYHSEMNTEVCEKYIVEMLPKIKAEADREGRPAALLLDNAKYHSRAVLKPPTQSDKKHVIQLWLSEHNILFDSKMTKPVLYQLVNEYLQANGGRLGNTVFYLDSIAAEHGVRIVRTPPYHCFMNPIELMWSQLKTHLRITGTTHDSLALVRQKALEFMNSFTKEQAQKLYAHVEKEEEELQKLMDQKEKDDEERARKTNAELSVMDEEGNWSADIFGESEEESEDDEELLGQE